MRKLIFVVVTFFLISVPSSKANNIYIAQSAAGASNGADCADAFAYTFFNTPSNWGTGSSQIGPGTTVHLCGTFTSGLAFQGDGASGSPITLLAENGANFTAATWTGDVIKTNGHSYLVIDGGTNGLIQATANGTSPTFANQNSFSAIGAWPCGHDFEIRNWTIRNLYQRTSNSSDYSSGSNSTGGISAGNCGSNISVHNNTVSMAHTGIIVMSSSTAVGNWSIYNNAVLPGECWGINVSAGNSSTSISGVYLHDNDVDIGNQWFDPADNYHMDGIFIYGQGGGVNIQGIYVYNNYTHTHTSWGGHVTAHIYINQNLQNVYVFNNVFDGTNAGAADGLYYFGYYTTNQFLYNNTFLGGGSTSGGIAIESISGVSGLDIRNNVVQNVQAAYYLPSSVTGVTIDRDVAYNVSGAGTAAAFYLNGSGYGSFSSWQGAGHDVHGTSSNPNLSSSGSLASGSPAIGLGANLYSICSGQPNPGLGALCFDKNGNARPTGASGLNWDAGAYSSGSTAGVPTPPSGLIATVQ